MIVGKYKRHFLGFLRFSCLDNNDFTSVTEKAICSPLFGRFRLLGFLFLAFAHEFTNGSLIISYN